MNRLKHCYPKCWSSSGGIASVCLRGTWFLEEVRGSGLCLCVLTAFVFHGFHVVLQPMPMTLSSQYREAKCWFVSCQPTTSPTAVLCLCWNQELRWVYIKWGSEGLIYVQVVSKMMEFRVSIFLGKLTFFWKLPTKMDSLICQGLLVKVPRHIFWFSKTDIMLTTHWHRSHSDFLQTI